MRTMLSYKNNSILSYAEIGEKLDMHRSSACRLIMHPERGTIDIILRVAEIIDMPIDEAKIEWRQKKRKQSMQNIDELAK